MSDHNGSGTPSKSPVRTGMPYKVYRQGFLLKSPARSVRKKLHRYWFVLFRQRDMLAFLYFQDEDHYLERKKNEGFFRIDDATSVDVIPEHLGRKNAFCIATPRSKYNLVSESRYELHHWLLALHEALEEYKNSTARRNKKKQPPAKQRSVSSINLPGSLPKTSPRIRPSRPAPPAPKDKKKGDEENTPPDIHPHAGASMEPLQDLPSPTTNKLDDIVAGLLRESHDMTGLDYSMMEDEDIHQDDESSSLSLSLPTLNDGTGQHVPASNGELNSDENVSPVHSRHLSLSDSYEFGSKKSDSGKKKSNRKRSSSMKGRRSVSPPNLPPPPPPPTNKQPSDEEGEQVVNSFDQDNIETETGVNNNTSQILSPRPPPPIRTTSLSPNKAAARGESGVKEYIEEAFLQEDDQVEEKSPGILRKGDHTKSPKRTVIFQEDRVKDRYEPRVDHESLPSTVAKAKQKLFGKNEAQSYKYNRQKINTYSNVEPQDELLQAIETALQPTSYMEEEKQSESFSTDVGGAPSVTPPIHHTHGNQNGTHSFETSPNDDSTGNPPIWSRPTVDDTPTVSTFTASEDTMYRSIV